MIIYNYFFFYFRNFLYKSNKKICIINQNRTITCIVLNTLKDQEHMGTFIFIIFLMIVGYTFKKLQLFPKQTAEVLNLLIIYVALPAVILLEVPKIEFSSAIIIPVLIPWVVSFFGALTILFFSKFFNWDKNTTGALLLVGILGNTSFLGIPIISHYYGVEGLPYVMIYDQLGTFLILSTYGAFVVAVYSGNSHIKLKASHIVAKILKFPPFISLIIAFCLHGVEFNADITKALTILGGTLIPMALISVGFSLELKLSKNELAPFIVGLSTKLVLIPIYAFIIVYLFDLKGVVTEISIVESAMGPMITAGVVASMAGFTPKLTSAIVGYGIILAMFTTAVVVELVKI